MVPKLRFRDGFGDGDDDADLLGVPRARHVPDHPARADRVLTLPTNAEHRPRPRTPTGLRGPTQTRKADVQPPRERAAFPRGPCPQRPHSPGVPDRLGADGRAAVDLYARPE